MAATIPLIALLIIAAVMVAAVLIIRSAHDKTIDAFGLMLKQRDKEYEILADRLFVKERLAPSGIDLTAAHQERVEDARIQNAERRSKGNRLGAAGIGPVDRQQNDMLQTYRKAHPPASAVLEEQIQNRQNTGAVA